VHILEYLSGHSQYTTRSAVLTCDLDVALTTMGEASQKKARENFMLSRALLN